jgi:hypothetical protein
MEDISSLTDGKTTVVALEQTVKSYTFEKVKYNAF